jgi:hypothetical protein
MIKKDTKFDKLKSKFFDKNLSDFSTGNYHYHLFLNLKE